MMIDTTAALGGGLLVAKDSAELGDHANAVLHDGCSGNNDTITMLRDLTARATAMAHSSITTATQARRAQQHARCILDWGRQGPLHRDWGLERPNLQQARHTLATRVRPAVGRTGFRR